MKLLIASDIHGSVYYLKKVLEAFEEEKGHFNTYLCKTQV